MNTLWIAILRHVLTGIGAGAVAHGWASQQDIESAVGAVIALISFGWMVYSKWKASQTVIKLIAISAVSFSLMGCQTFLNQDKKIIAATSSVLGIDISESPENNIPHIRFGYIRTQLHMVPTVKETNQFIWTPSVVSTMTVSNKPLQQIVIENFATGKAAETLVNTNR